MLNVGPLELLVVLAVALVVVGPDRLPELARSVGRALRQFRQVQGEVRDMVATSVDPEVREAAAELRKATGDLRRATDVRGAVKRTERDLRGQAPGAGTSPRRSPGSSKSEEAGGPPADRLVQDGAADPSTEAPSRPAVGEPTAEPEPPQR